MSVAIVHPAPPVTSRGPCPTPVSIVHPAPPVTDGGPGPVPVAIVHPAPPVTDGGRDPMPVAIVHPAPPVTDRGPVPMPVAIVHPAPPVTGRGPGPMPVAIVHPAHPLTGRGTGEFTSQHKNPDTGSAFHLNGKAMVQGLGKVTVNGDIHGPGFIKSDIYTGRLTLRTGHGQVVVELTSFRPAGPAGLPVWYRYHIVSGTGPFKTMHDSGSLRLDVQLDPSMGPSADQHGTFRMTI
jgi:hypothetical protein